MISQRNSWEGTPIQKQRPHSDSNLRRCGFTEDPPWDIADLLAEISLLVQGKKRVLWQEVVQKPNFAQLQTDPLKFNGLKDFW